MRAALSGFCVVLVAAIAAGCGAETPGHPQVDAVAAAAPEAPAGRTGGPAAEKVVARREVTAAREIVARRGAAGPKVVARRCATGSLRPLGSKRLAHAAFVRRSATAYRRPGGAELRRFGRLNVNGHATVFGVLGEVVDARCKPRWYHVRLPMKPNGATGYVRAADVRVATVRTRIVIDLSDRRVTLLRDGREVLRATAAIGSPATPTPTGEYYVDQRLIPADRSGPFGPGAIGISAFSEVLTGWVQGGPVAIHGTNRPSSVGRAVSNGCLRLRNDVLQRLFDATPAGTPVTIRA